MVKHLTLVSLLLGLLTGTGLCQGSKFLLVGPSLGLNRSWRIYDKPTSNFQKGSSNGFDAGLNLFYKSKGKFGFLGDLSFVLTKSSITTTDYFSSASKIELTETSQWLSLGSSVLFFPIPKSKGLPFFGTGLSMAYLDKSDVKVCVTHDPDQFTFGRNLNDFRKNNNYFFKVLGGMTTNQFDRHRIMLLATYSIMIGPFTQSSKTQNGDTYVAQYVLPFSLGNEYSVNTLTVKLIMAL